MKTNLDLTAMTYPLSHRIRLRFIRVTWYGRALLSLHPIRNVRRELRIARFLRARVHESFSSREGAVDLVFAIARLKQEDGLIPGNLTEAELREQAHTFVSRLRRPADQERY